jgi:hypothetical protein
MGHLDSASAGSPSPDGLLAELLAREQIRETIARINRSNDRGDPQLKATGFHDDAEVTSGFADRRGPVGTSPFTIPPVAFHHHIGSTAISVVGDTAVSETYIYAVHRFEYEGELYDYEARCRYLDNWERRDDGPFKIARRMVVFDWVRTDKVDGEWPPPDPWVTKFEPGGRSVARDVLYWGTPTQEYRGEASTRDDHSYGVVGTLSSLGNLMAGDGSASRQPEEPTTNG